MKKIGIAVCILLLAATAQGTNPTSFDDAEGLRVAVEKQFENDVKELEQHFSRYKVNLEIGLVNEYSSQKYASQIVVYSYRDRKDTITSYIEKEEFKKALRALLKMQEAEISALKSYKLLENKAWLWLNTTDKANITTVDARAWLIRAKGIYNETKINTLMDEDAVGDIEVMKKEVTKRDQIITNLLDYRDNVINAAEALYVLTEEPDKKPLWEKLSLLIDTKLNETEILLNELNETNRDTEQYNFVYSDLLARAENIQQLAKKKNYGDAVAKGEALDSSIDSLNGKIRMDINDYRTDKRNAVAIFFISIVLSAIRVVRKGRQLWIVDDDLKPTVAKELVKTILITVALLFIAAVLISIFIGPFPFYF